MSVSFYILLQHFFMRLEHDTRLKEYSANYFETGINFEYSAENIPWWSNNS